MKGFFSEAESSFAAHLPLIAECGACGLFRRCKSPRMPYAGKGRRKILVVGEAPGAEEDERGEPFVGKSGKRLEEALAKAGCSLRQDCWITNAAICRPPDNRLPDKAVAHCRPNLIETVEKLRPEVVILVGARAVQSLIGWLWKEDLGEMNRWVGWKIPAQAAGGVTLNCWVCPTWHPSHILRLDPRRGESRVQEMLWEQHLAEAVAIEGRPWKKVPDYGSQVRVVMAPSEAADMVRQMTRGRRPVAFDYETTSLKPDGPRAEIVSCSVSDGKTTLAYPWHGDAVAATGELLRSKLPKIASNLKFEERWTWKEFNHGVNNWDWDTMVAGHVLDNRRHVTSIKFQAFVRLGQPSWDDEVKQYLRTEGGNTVNRIRDFPLRKLLVYNGLDSFLEWKVAKIQKREAEADTGEDWDNG